MLQTILGIFLFQKNELKFACSQNIELTCSLAQLVVIEWLRSLGSSLAAVARRCFLGKDT